MTFFSTVMDILPQTRSGTAYLNLTLYNSDLHRETILNPPPHRNPRPPLELRIPCSSMAAQRSRLMFSAMNVSIVAMSAYLRPTRGRGCLCVGPHVQRVRYPRRTPTNSITDERSRTPFQHTPTRLARGSLRQTFSWNHPYKWSHSPPPPHTPFIKHKCTRSYKY